MLTKHMNRRCSSQTIKKVNNFRITESLALYVIQGLTKMILANCEGPLDFVRVCVNMCVILALLLEEPFCGGHVGKEK